MALATRDRQQIYTRLAPVIGEEEAGTLLDQFPSTADTELVTVARLAETERRIDLLDAKIDMVELRLNAKIDQAVERLEKLIHQQMRNQTILMITTIIAVLGLAETNIFG